MDRVVRFVVSGLVAAIAIFLATPNIGFAAGTVEVDINYYLCPDDASSLADCTWEGEYFKPCTGTAFLDGTRTGNYKVTGTEPCSSGTSWFSCEVGIACEWVYVSGVGWKLICQTYDTAGCLDD